MRCAAIDIGTNSCRLLIAEVINNRISRVCMKIDTTRLGESLLTTGVLSSSAIERTTRSLMEFKNLADRYEVKTCTAVATSAVREASNSGEFITYARSRVGIPIQIINAQEEAKLSYLGVIKGLSFALPPAVLDLGGGSTEFILDQGFITSLPIGAVKATELSMSVMDISATISKSEIVQYKDKIRDNPLVFVGGTATSMVAVKQAMEVYDRELIHGQVLTRREVADLYNMLERMPLNLRKRLPGLQAERADIIPKGALIILLLMDFLGKEEIIVSESDLLEGIIWQAIDDS